MAAQKGNTVSVHYKGTLEDGTVFDDSTSRDALQFTIGEGHVIPGFEGAVVGMTEGESKTFTVSAADGYGPHRREMVLEVQREQLPDNLDLEVGQMLQISREDGQSTRVTVTGLSESTVTLDGNHPLAGRDLTFHIQLLEIH